MRTSVDTSTASKCVTGIYTSNYNVTFYDMDYNNVPYTTEYAIKLTNQLVTGLSSSTIISSPNFISSIFSSSINIISSSPTTILDNGKLLYYYYYIHYIYTTAVKGDSSVIIYISKFINDTMWCYYCELSFIVIAVILTLVSVIIIVIVMIIVLCRANRSKFNTLF